MSQIVSVSFGSASQAKRAVHNLLVDHFPREHIRARGPGFSPPPPRPPLTDAQKEAAQWGAGMGAGIGGMWGGLIALISFALPADAGVIQPLALLLGGAALGVLVGGAFGMLLGVRVPKRIVKEAVDSRPITVAVEADSAEEAELARADLMDVMGPFRPKMLDGTATSSVLDRAVH